ncbi:outer membrane efflux protein [Chloroherpeton thalassium ATCC 35110]|uniref:Outer membrane efflux protein n=1 Tax=Chloroherpeton thalassium (strain ATCC 35110 / GB-78) TaxID=517418 RepID=B3QYJ9_CHLT3|nr:TolC family protein [Chloroherpeton thalassium]ACF13627.1 outer membrane efflux protein [Chloroherpeton thalassium ATCC 35110]
MSQKTIFMFESLKKAAWLPFILGLIFFHSDLAAQEQLSLDNALELALEKNQSVKVARAEAEISQNNVHLGNAGLLPSLDVSTGFSYQQQRQIGNVVTSNSAMTTTSAEIEASYTIFNGLKNIYTLQKLKTAGTLGDLQARSTIEEIVVSVSEAYYDVANAHEQFLYAKESLEISNQRLARAKKQSEFGQANAVDVLSATVDLNTDSVSYLNARLNLDKAKRTLNVLLNRDAEMDFSVSSDVAFREGLKLEALKELALENSAAYLIAKKNLEQSELELKIARAAYYPELSASVGYGLTEYANGFNPTLSDPIKGVSASVSLSMNLFNGCQDAITTQNAAITINNNEQLEEKAKLELLRDLSNTLQTYQNSRNVLNFQQQNLKSAELNFTRTKELFEVGQATVTTFREAQLNLIQAKNNISAAKYDAKVYELQLMRLAGKLVDYQRK